MEDRYVIGFDESCTRCSGIAHSIESVAGDRLGVIPLRSAWMQRWRVQTLGDDARWAPTLVRVRGEDAVDAWVGWRMGPVLLSVLGPRRSTAVLNILGDHLVGEGKSASPSRRTFLGGSMGAVVGLGLLAGTSRFMSQKPGSPQAQDGAAGADGEGEVPADAITELSGDDLIDTAMRHLRSEDAANIVEPTSFGARTQSASSMQTLPREALAEATDTTGEQSAGGALEVAGKGIRHSGGVAETTVLVYQHEQQLLLISTDYSEPVRGEQTHVHRLHVDHDEPDGPMLKTVTRSINGGVPRPAPTGEHVRVMSSGCDDPCGGCSRSGRTCSCGTPGREQLTTQCNWSWTVDCVLGGIGCAACAGCAWWFKCAACMVGSCITAVRSCCSSASQVCAGCRPCQT